jgi:predicted secreted protein
MKPNVAKAGMGPRGASLAVLVGIGFAAPVLAGDRALIDYLGYSDDGRYFAFEEFGVQDGSGFPYSNLYLIDLPADKWVPGTPYRVRLDDEEAGVDEARIAARELAEAKLDEFEIDVAAHTIAHNADGETGDGHELSFGRPGYGLEPPQNVARLTLETFAAPSAQDCVTFLGEEAKGFALYLDGDEIYRDGGTLPQSRGCPMDYRIHAVVRPAEWSGADGGTVAVIANYPFGFEGPDRRFLIIPLGD